MISIGKVWGMRVFSGGPYGVGHKSKIIGRKIPY
jgi:hypothetical protein